MLTRWVCGIALITCTVLLQLAAQTLLARGIAARGPRRNDRRGLEAPFLPSLLTVIVLIFGHLAQVALWAVMYLVLGDLHGFPDAMYFSLASFTTVGAAELELSKEHRMLGALEAGVGALMFGWSTALLVALVGRAADDAAASAGGRSLHHAQDRRPGT
jgi:hypothetical protein